MAKRMKRYNLFLLFFLFIHNPSVYATTTNWIRLDYGKIYTSLLNADAASVLSLMPTEKFEASHEDKIFIEKFRDRFAFLTDRSDYLSKRASEIDPLLRLFVDYWRESLINPSQDINSVFIDELVLFFTENMKQEDVFVINAAKIGYHLREYIERKDLFTTDEFTKTGRLYDLVVWRSQTDTIFTLDLLGEKVKTRVVFIRDFITHGWQEYATLGRSYSKGWATGDALFYVVDEHDLESESFLVSFLAHESRHFEDFRKFPNLKDFEFEYRAKLTELSLAKTTLYELLHAFINFSDRNSDDAHLRANYTLIRDLSKRLFYEDFVDDIRKWESLYVEQINNAARSILQENTDMLLSANKENHIVAENTFVYTVVTECISRSMMQKRCNSNTPGWGDSLGTVSFASDRVRVVGNQIWSDVVQATGCDKSTFNGVNRATLIFNADCRSNPRHKGSLFSWCAIVRFQDILCPAPWRAPTASDFIEMDRTLGGTGKDRIDIRVRNKIRNRWGGIYQGYSSWNGTIERRGEGAYWSLSEHCADTGLYLYFTRDGVVNPQERGGKGLGRTLRCVRDR